MAMQCGIFMTPYNPPSRTPRQVFDWAVDIAHIADEAGYDDFMIGEHYTLAWENIPMPEAIIRRCRAVGIRMSGGFDSLNVAATSAVALHQLTAG